MTEKQSMLEIGTRSGCLSITLAGVYPQWKIHACDISAAALRVARNNASLHRRRAHLRFHRGDLFDGLVLSVNSST
jgi:release factor glutamine methyltransferase